MADNTTITAMTGGDVIATDDIAGVKHQRVKVEFGADGAAADVSASNPLPVDVISAIPAGTNTIGDVGLIAGSATIGSVKVTDGTDTAGVHDTGTTAVGMNTLPLGVVADYYPNNRPSVYPGVDDTFHRILDPDGSTQVRGGILSDEGSYYTSFPGSTLPPEVATVTGTGQTITVANSRCTIAAGTTAGAEAYISVPIDYLPLRCQMMIEISQRIANQDIYFELADGATPDADTTFVRFHWTGTTNTFVRCESQSSADTNGNEGTATDVTIAATSSPLVYTIELSMLGATFLYGADTLESNQLAKRSNEIPGPYTSLYGRVRVKNGGSSPASNTNIVMHWGSFQNLNRVDVNNSYNGEPVHVAGQIEARTTTLPNKATEMDTVHMMGDGIGRSIVALGMPREFVATGNATLSTTTETTLVAAGAAGIFHDLHTLVLTNTSATPVRVDMRDATGGTVKFSIALAANGGAVLNLPVAIPQTTAANNWTVQLSGAVTDVRCYGLAVKTK